MLGDSQKSVRGNVGPLGTECLPIAKNQFEAMVKFGTACSLASSWAVPIYSEKKWSLAIMRRLQGTQITDVSRSLSSTAHPRLCVKVLWDEDLFKNQSCESIQSAASSREDVPKTGIITPFKLFEFPFMKLGLPDPTQMFQRFIDDLLSNLDLRLYRRYPEGIEGWRTTSLTPQDRPPEVHRCRQSCKMRI